MKNFSIIIPAYNCEKYIDRCLDSIVPQLADEDQIIVVNDCSTDRTLEVLNNRKKDKRICIINKKINQGVSKARNDGISKAKNDVVLFIDGDDYISQDYLNFLRTKNCDASIITGLTYVDESTKKEFSLLPNNLKNGNNVFFQLDMEDLLHSACNKTYKLSILKDNNIRFNENVKMMEDYEFNLHYYKVSDKVEICPKSFYYYSYHGTDSASSKFQKNLFERYKQIKQARYLFYDKKVESDTIDKLNINFLLVCVNNLYKSRDNNLTKSDRINILKEIFELSEFKKWKKGKKSGINEKIIFIATITNSSRISDFTFRVLHYMKNNFSFLNTWFRKHNRKNND